MRPSDENDLLDFEEEDHAPQYYYELGVMFLICTAATYLLFMIDVDFRLDFLLTWQMFVSSFIYTIPTFIVSFFLFTRLIRVFESRKALIISVFVSIPLVFSLLIYALSS